MLKGYHAYPTCEITYDAQYSKSSMRVDSTRAAQKAALLDRGQTPHQPWPGLRSRSGASVPAQPGFFLLPKTRCPEILLGGNSIP
jgi:hypothetical protein